MNAPRTSGWKRRKITVEQWNAAHPIGTPVRYYWAEGVREFEVTRTTSEAYETQNGPMAHLEGKGGGYLVSHLQALTGDQAEIDAALAEAESKRKFAGVASDLNGIAREVERTAEALRKHGHIDPMALKRVIERMALALIDVVRLECEPRTWGPDA